MKSKIPQRSLVAYYLLSIITLGIYNIYFWQKLSKQVNVLCEGDGKKTMKFFPACLLNIVTLFIFGIVWRAKLADRLKDNAERYNLDFSESGAVIAVSSTIGLVALLTGPEIAKCLIIKNFNKIANAYNEYNGLVDPDEDKMVHLFGDEEVEL